MTAPTLPSETPMTDDYKLAEIDDWCKARAAKLLERSNAHIEAGKGLDDPGYRVLLGEHRAYLAVRSFIHGEVKSRASGDR